MAASLAIIRDSQTAQTAIGPVRKRVLEALRDPGSATTVGERLGLTRQKVNYHLRALEKVGLVEHVEDRRRGNCTERIVRATATHYLIDPTLLSGPELVSERPADRFSADHLAATAARTLGDLATLREGAATAGKRVPTLSLETRVRFATPADRTAFFERLANQVAKLVAEYHDEEAPDGRAYRVTLGAHPALRPPNDHLPVEQP